MKKEFRANGKLLLSGEYFVLDGAQALVMPLRYGQTMKVDNTGQDHILEWSAYVYGKPWFSAKFRRNDLEILMTSEAGMAQRLQMIFVQIARMKPGIFTGKEGLKFRTDLESNPEFGWGTSSSLISLLSQWAGINPYELYFSLWGGSAYDIAAATTETFFLYRCEKREPVVTKTFFSPSFAEDLFLVFLGKKQGSENEIRKYRDLPKPSLNAIKRISKISRSLPSARNLGEFEDMIIEHEKILGYHLDRITLKESMFPDYPGAVKSLGAWGGDFALFTSADGKDSLESYLNKKGLNTWFRLGDLSPVTNDERSLS
jgi:mevalonate kinase